MGSEDRSQTAIIMHRAKKVHDFSPSRVKTFGGTDRDRSTEDQSTQRLGTQGSPRMNHLGHFLNKRSKMLN